MKKNPRYIVDYDTKWTNITLEPKDSICFKAKTPIEEIVPKLQKHLNNLTTAESEKNQNDLSSFKMGNFSCLYRNIYGSYKGWQVLYRKPGSNGDYHPISEKIGYKPVTRKPTGLKSTLSRSMVWKHELDPLIKPVKVKRVRDCGVIAEVLNQQFAKTFINEILENGLPILKSLNQNYEQILEQNLNLTVLAKSSNWQTVLKTVSEFNHLIKIVDFSNSKDYRISRININEVLAHRNKTAKGWQVEFLD